MRAYGRPVDASAFRAVDLGALAREAVDLTRPRWQDEAQREGRTIAVRLDPPAVAAEAAAPDAGRGAPVQGDPAALREVLVNLLFNACDALPAGGTVTLRVAPWRGGPPPAEAGAAAGWTELSVADTGTGMAADVRRRAFEPFFTTKGAGGTGLGLAMVRKVVDAHGGVVELETAPGRGTTFRLRFPAAPAGAAAPEAAAADADAVPPARIVVVDDQPDVLDTLSMLLRRDGHDVRAFGDPRAAVDAVRAARPDVLLTDLGMPGLSGWDVARLARERWPDLPVVLLTGWGRDLSATQLRAHGVLLALAKPAELPVLRAALARALRPAAAAPLDILLVDDATAFASVLGVLLGQGGHRVRRVERAAAAVQALRGDAPVDLVILALNLPDGPSAAVLRAARARPRPPAVCVVSGSDPAAMESGVPGADLYAEKAYVPEQLERIYAAARARRPPAG
jgi:CheY-like chemotaxis protein